MKNLIITLAAAGTLAHGGTLFLGMYPNWVAVFDESKGQIVDKIHLDTGLPTSLRLSTDRKTIYATTNDHNGVEVIDVATHKVKTHLVLDTPTERYRFNGGVADADGKLFYTVAVKMDKKPDRYEIGKPQYTVIDLAQQKVVQMITMEPEDEKANSGEVTGGFGLGPFEISPDGKYLFQFRDKVVVLSLPDFKVVERIDLAKPDFPGMQNIGFGGLLDSIGEPGRRVTVFNYSDPIVHNKVFGIARFDLTTRKMNFTTIGPSPDGMSGLQIAPDQKSAFVVVSQGQFGNRRCEFWSFNLSNDRIDHTLELPCRTRFSFGMSADGKKLYIFGAGFEIEVYDAVTLKHERTWDLANDITMAGLVVIP